MATVKIHEGTKFETPLDLQDDEGVIFISPEKNRIIRRISLGCFKGNKQYGVNVVITSKRVITVPIPPNKKNYPVESFYWKDIASARTIKATDAADAARSANFSISMKPGQTSSCSEGGEFWVCMAQTAKNWVNLIKADHAVTSAQNAAMMNTSLRMASGQDYVYTKASLDKYYANMEKAAKDRAANMDFSKADHSQIRDYIVDLIDQCAAEAAKG
jgi:hypothetical protein